MNRRVSVIISGRVQGVFFRATAREKAVGLGLTGWVRNRPDGSVELLAEGTDAAVAALLQWCQSGPPRARVDECRVKQAEPLGDLTDFLVVR